MSAKSMFFFNEHSFLGVFCHFLFLDHVASVFSPMCLALERVLMCQMAESGLSKIALSHLGHLAHFESPD